MKPESIQLNDVAAIADKVKATGVVTNSVAQIRTKNIQISSTGIIQGNRTSPNPWSYQVNRQDMLRGRVRIENVNTVRTVDGLLASDPQGGGVWISPWDASVNTRLYNEALSKLNDKLRGGLDISEDIADRRNVQRINKSMISLVGLADQVSRSARGKIAVISSLWLQRQYTWKPLVGTIYDAASNILSREQRTLRASASSFMKVPPRVDATISIRGFYPTAVPIRYYPNGKYACKIGVTVNSNKLLLGNFTTLDPLVLAWNLFPYSFIVDWVFNVGAYLRDKETTTRYKASFVSGYVSHILAEHVVGEVQYESSWGGFPFIVSGRNGAFNCRFQRTALLSYPFPRAPVFHMDLGLERMFTLASLLGTKLGVRK
jgi:hypothetical protein